ncbi:unnamed protein product [Larinioides sclopetarius]|uniref:Uncharacterized protein n=1 Tax=Larinioides sclopetarius TaxID=280406 RepID=A0AAV2BYE2_9ARAC
MFSLIFRPAAYCTGRKLLRPRARISLQGYKILLKKMARKKKLETMVRKKKLETMVRKKKLETMVRKKKLETMKISRKEEESSDSDVAIIEEIAAPFAPFDPAIPGFSNKEVIPIWQDPIPKYRYISCHKIDNRKINPDLIAIAEATEHKELELRFDFDGEYHGEMKAYGVYFGSRSEKIKTEQKKKSGNEACLFRKSEYRLLGIVRALPLPMKINITFDRSPMWCGEIYFTVRYQDAKEELGPFSKPVTCIFQSNELKFEVVKSDFSKFDFSGPDPLIDADGMSFFPLP